MILQGPSRMAEPPLTRVTLLNRLKDGADADAWREFVHLYGPVVYGFARKRGLQDADAADLTQAVLRQVAAHVGSLEYDPRRGTFRGWLFTIVRNRLRDFLRQPRQLYQGSGSPKVQGLLESLPGPEPEETEAWEREYRLGLLAWAAEQVRPQVREKTWQAFWQTAVDGRPGAEVARALGLTPAAVYLARGRVMARLRAAVREAQDEE